MSTQFLTTIYTQPHGRVPYGQMARALRTPKFGKWLRFKRDGASLEEFAIRIRPHAQPFGLEFDRSQITKLEKGRLPSLPIVWALSSALRISVAELEQKIAAELSGIEIGTTEVTASVTDDGIQETKLGEEFGREPSPTGDRLPQSQSSETTDLELAVEVGNAAETLRGLAARLAARAQARAARGGSTRSIRNPMRIPRGRGGSNRSKR